MLIVLIIACVLCILFGLMVYIEGDDHLGLGIGCVGVVLGLIAFSISDGPKDNPKVETLEEKVTRLETKIKKIEDDKILAEKMTGFELDCKEYSEFIGESRIVTVDESRLFCANQIAIEGYKENGYMIISDENKIDDFYIRKELKIMRRVKRIKK